MGDGSMTCREAGRRGGEALKRKLGAGAADHYGRIALLAPPRPRAWMREIARRGGATTREHFGTAHFAEIGRAGGEAVLARYGTAYYAAMGRAGAAVRKARREAADGRP